jgi:hypothetical protein
MQQLAHAQRRRADGPLSEPDSRVIEAVAHPPSAPQFLREIGAHYRPELRTADGPVFYVRNTSAWRLRPRSLT